MQEKTEDIVTFKALKERLHDWEIRHLWAVRLIEYSILSLLVSLVGAIFFKIFDLFQTDAESARYMLSAMVQAQAAIVAIVVTLTLVAVQLTASAYSPRVVRIFRNNPDIWILLLFYGVSISYGLLVLKMIREGDLKQISLFWAPLEYHISSAYIAVNFTFFMLFLYMWNIINLLNPTTIINRLATEITKDNLLRPEEDPIQPIMDIVHGSIMKYDIATTRVGLKAVTERIVKNIDLDRERGISKLFCEHLMWAGRLATSREDEGSTVEVIKSLEKFGKISAEKRLEDATSRAARSLEDIGRITAEKKLGDATAQAVTSLGAIETVAIEKSLQVVEGFIAVNLTNIAKAAIKNDLEEASVTAVISFRDVGMIAVKKGLIYELELTVACLEEVGTTALAKEGFDIVTLLTVSSLINIGLKTAADRDVGYDPRQAAKSLAELTMIGEKNVRTAIQDYESELKEDRVEFQHFMDLYKQELEKLRAEQQKTV